MSNETTLKTNLHDDGPIPTPDSGVSTRRVLAYLMRAIMMRATKASLGEHRYSNRCSELTGALRQLAIATKSTAEFIAAVAGRFGVSLGGDAAHPWAICAWLPDAAQPDGVRKVRWDRIAAVLDFERVRLVVLDCPDLLSTFACTWVDKDDAESRDADEATLASLPEPIPFRGRSFAIGANAIRPRRYRSVWTTASEIAHGADEKTGNVNGFRRQDIIDQRTGRRVSVPFISGNAVRGRWRRLLMARYCELVGVLPRELPTQSRFHALFSGGTTEAGADTGKVDVVTRSRARALCPPWDLIAGIVDSQIMGGRGAVFDAKLVCRENAWRLRTTLAPEQDLEEFASSLQSCESMTTTRQLVRSAHKDVPDAEGIQMMARMEVLLPGAQFVHEFALVGLGGVSEVTLSCLADLLEGFGSQGLVGAGNARGFGEIQFAPYVADDGLSELPSSNAYLEFIAANRDDCRAWLLDIKSEGEAEKAASAKKGRAKKVEANVTLA